MFVERYMRICKYKEKGGLISIYFILIYIKDYQQNLELYIIELYTRTCLPLKTPSKESVDWTFKVVDLKAWKFN